MTSPFFPPDTMLGPPPPPPPNPPPPKPPKPPAPRIIVSPLSSAETVDAIAINRITNEAKKNSCCLLMMAMMLPFYSFTRVDEFSCQVLDEVVLFTAKIIVIQEWNGLSFILLPILVFVTEEKRKKYYLQPDAVDTTIIIIRKVREATLCFRVSLKEGNCYALLDLFPSFLPVSINSCRPRQETKIKTRVTCDSLVFFLKESISHK